MVGILVVTLSGLGHLLNVVGRWCRRRSVVVCDKECQVDMTPTLSSVTSQTDPSLVVEGRSTRLRSLYKKKRIPAAIKRLVWNIYVGETIGKTKCMCCNWTDITQSSFHCGHVIAESRGGQITVDNLRPICQNCNSSMGSENMMDFIDRYRIRLTTTGGTGGDPGMCH